MSEYFYSACHSCKQKVMYDKAPDDQCIKWHFNLFKHLHQDHDTVFFSEYDEEMYDKVMKYKDLGLWPTDIQRRVNNMEDDIYLRDAELLKAAYALDCRYGLGDELVEKIYNYMEKKTGENYRL